MRSITTASNNHSHNTGATSLSPLPGQVNPERTSRFNNVHEWKTFDDDDYNNNDEEEEADDNVDFPINEGSCNHW